MDGSSGGHVDVGELVIELDSTMEKQLNLLIFEIIKWYADLQRAIFYSTRMADINQANLEIRKIEIFKFKIFQILNKIKELYNYSTNKDYLDEIIKICLAVH